MALEDYIKPGLKFQVHIGLTSAYADMFTAKMEKEGNKITSVGDGWEKWGDDRGTNGNDVNTFHIVTELDDIESAILLASSTVKNFHEILVSQQRQNAEDQNGIVAVVTHAINWDERIMEIYGTEYGQYYAKFRSSQTPIG